MMSCKKCGAELSEDSNFCSKCGVPIHGEDLDTKLKKQQYENEKAKSGWDTIKVVGLCGLVLCFTATPIVGFPVMLLGFAVGVWQMTKEK